MRRAAGIAGVLAALAGCDALPADGANPGLFEPRLFNDLPYNVSFVGSGPVEDAGLVAQGFTTARDIAVFRMTGAPFGPGDMTEAEAVAADFCIGPARVFAPAPDRTRLDGGGVLFSGACPGRDG